MNVRLKNLLPQENDELALSSQYKNISDIPLSL
jgi:hypothetical protein